MIKEEEVGEVMDARATIAKASTMDDEYDTRKGSDANYYSIAHTLRETVSQQPGIMAFGQMKEYQVRGMVREGPERSVRGRGGEPGITAFGRVSSSTFRRDSVAAKHLALSDNSGSTSTLQHC